MRASGENDTCVNKPAEGWKFLPGSSAYNRTWIEWPRAGGRVQIGHVAGCQPHHPVHKIDARDLFGNAMFHLQARVHFQEVELLGIGIVDELHSARHSDS